MYEYCVRNKLVDAALIAKWKKPGYERLCSTYVINTKNYKFGSVSICRVPKHALGPDTVVEDPFTGCLGCASGPGGQRNIFGNKYGQYLAAIQVAREEERSRRDAAAARAKAAAGGGEGSDADTDSGDEGITPPAATARSKQIWAVNDAERQMETADTAAGAGEAEREAASAVKCSAGGGGGGGDEGGSSSSGGDGSGAKRPRY